MAGAEPEAVLEPEPEPEPEERLPPIPRNGVRNCRMIGSSRISSRTDGERGNYAYFINTTSISIPDNEGDAGCSVV